MPSDKTPNGTERFSERQWNAQAALICDGDEPHIAPVPDVRLADGVTGPVECAECGAAMDLCHVLTIDPRTTWGELAYRDRPPLYTTAKLHPLKLITALSVTSATGNSVASEKVL